ncbi:ABC transporter ATP-binding protein [Pigmentiphaga aceris]|uniref:ABC transporter ATP-binding protein n=1 Tax=Pigmentiphaga aceris TaxID=1940612 RepID=A0A5C0B1N9_9BURK|nr:ABC transporter ATP-binding protein [Pigmentiphaga aceris]QEI07683.1 ABC transporter ATP-binding protein [Pigmentiphaga aceris]
MFKRFRPSRARHRMVLGSCIGLLSATAFAEVPDSADGPSWQLFASPYTMHWSHDDDHKPVFALGIERIDQDRSLWGASAFRNSFGQASAYVYYGRQWDHFLGQPALYAKISGGLMYGYRGKFRNKVPLNVGGVSPAIVPAIGYRVTPQSAVQLNVLGTAALMFSYNRNF